MNDRLEQIQARVEAADAAPWRMERHDLSLWVHSADEGLEANLGYIGNRPEGNADFIANAREDVPYLLTLVREQQARLDAILALVRHAEACGPQYAVQPAAIRAALTATEAAS